MGLRRRAHLSWLCGALSVLAPPVALHAEVARGEIVGVTVFPDRAEVERERAVTVPIGPTQVVFTGLPLGIDPGSIRMSAIGVPARLGEVEVEREVAAGPDREAIAEAQTAVERLEDEIARLDGIDAVRTRLSELLEQIGKAVAHPDSGEPAQRVAKLYAFVEDRLRAQNDGRAAQRRARRAVERELARARSLLAEMRSPTSTDGYRVRVTLESDRSGPLRVRIQYVVEGAAWKPAYRADLDPETGALELAALGVVQQSTGEDWADVALRLSTATPARGLTPPDLDPLVLLPVEAGVPIRVRGSNAAADAGEGVEEITVTASQIHVRPAPRPPALVGFEATPQTAPLVRAAYVGTFRVPGPANVPADGRDHRLPLRRSSLRAELEYLVSHATGDDAFLIAHTRAPDYPILPGELRAFVAGAYLGSLELEEKPSRAPLDIPFGIDRRLVVTRTVVPREISSAGLFGSQREASYAFSTRLENLTEVPARVVVRDRIPVSEDRRLRVSVPQAVRTEWRELADRPSIVERIVELAPHQAAEIRLEYRLRVPEGVAVPDLR